MKLESLQSQAAVQVFPWIDVESQMEDKVRLRRGRRMHSESGARPRRFPSTATLLDSLSLTRSHTEPLQPAFCTI